MIITDFYFLRAGTRPLKANSKLIVDSNRVLSRSIPLQLLQVIPRRNAKIVQRFRYFELKELAQRDALNLRKSRNALMVRQTFCIFICIRYDHNLIITRRINNVK